MIKIKKTIIFPIIILVASIIGKMIIGENPIEISLNIGSLGLGFIISISGILFVAYLVLTERTRRKKSKTE